MKIIEMDAQTILEQNTANSSDKAYSYSVNPYLGCEQKCIFCTNRTVSDKYEEKLIVYKNSIPLFHNEMINKYKGGLIALGTRTEIFQPSDEKYKFADELLNTIRTHNAPVHILTKSNKILKSRESLKSLSKNLIVSFSISTNDEYISSIFEPHSPLPVKRLEAMNVLRQMGISTGVIFQPVFPYLSDSTDTIENVIRLATSYRADYIIFSPTLFLRPDLKDYFYNSIKVKFPGVLKECENLYRDNDIPPQEYISRLIEIFSKNVQKYNISTSFPYIEHQKSNNEQLNMF